MSACYTCGGEIGEHFGQCPEGAEALLQDIPPRVIPPFELTLETVTAGRGRTYEAPLFGAEELSA